MIRKIFMIFLVSMFLIYISVSLMAQTKNILMIIASQNFRDEEL